MLTRRDFARSLGACLVLLGLERSSGAGTTGAATLYDTSFVLDANSLASAGQTPPAEQAALVKAVRQSGVAVVKCTLGGGGGSFEQTLADLAALEQLIELWPKEFMNVRVAEDMERARQERKLGFIYSFEAASMLEGRLDRIELFRHLGVRVMQLTYNRRSPFGVGCVDGDAGGLTEIGRQAVARMNELGVAVDLSHSNTQTTREAIALSTRPVVISHAGCRAVYDHPRNKEDQDLKALADKGGVMGIYMLPFLAPSPKQPTLEDYMGHMEHALKVCGEDHVGVGSDVPFDKIGPADLDAIRKDITARKAAGISAPGEDRPPYIPELNTPRKMEIIADALLKRGHSSGAVEKILGLNFRRVFTQVWARA